jgi:hypothetical protein
VFSPGGFHLYHPTVGHNHRTSDQIDIARSHDSHICLADGGISCDRNSFSYMKRDNFIPIIEITYARQMAPSLADGRLI